MLQSFALFGLVAKERFINYFGVVNFRMIAVPSAVLDLYGASHFCQIIFLKPFIACPYSEPLAVVMSQNYPLGSANGSLLAARIAGLFRLADFYSRNLASLTMKQRKYTSTTVSGGCGAPRHLLTGHMSMAK